MPKIFSKGRESSDIKTLLERKRKIADVGSSNFKVSFQYFDTSQKFASSFRDWQKIGLLSKMLETLSGYCCSPLIGQADGKKFTIYGNYPPKDRTMFDYPAHVPEDATWARIHIENKAVIAGHILDDTFYVVFLDKSHKFYMTKQAAGIK